MPTITLRSSLSRNLTAAEVDANFTGIKTELEAATANVATASSTAGAALAAANAINKTSLGLGNVDNTSDINKPVSIATANALSNISASQITSGQFPMARLASGVPDGSKFVRDDGTLQSIPGGGDALTANPLSQFAATTSLQLKGIITDETGSGSLVFGTAPNITSPTGIVKGDVGLGNVDNTPDASKPVSTATQAALNLKANIANPTFTGTVTLAQDAASALQAVTLQQLQAAAFNVGKRTRARVTTTANITIATLLVPGQVLNGVTLANGDLVLVKDQTTAAQNGLYVVGTVPVRAAEFDTWAEFPGSVVSVYEGTVNGDTLWFCTNNDGGTLDSTAIVFTQFTAAGSLLAANNLSDVASASIARTNLGAAAATSGTLTTPTFSGITTADGAQVMTANAMGALVIDVTKGLNTKSFSADATLTFSGTPATANTLFALRIKNTDSVNPHTLTFPSVFRDSTQTTAAHTMVIPASGEAFITFCYDGTRTAMYGGLDFLNNFTATTAPSVNDDLADGYGTGSWWYDATGNSLYICETAAAGAAVWTAVASGGGSGDMLLAGVQTVTGAKTFNSSKLILAGSTSGTVTLNAPAVAGTTTITLPGATGTVATLAGTEALTNKTYNGNTLTASTGTLTLSAGKTLAANNSLTFAGTDGTTLTFPTTSATIPKTVQTEAGFSFGIDTVANQDYTIILRAPHAGTITETSSKCTSGTATATFKINGTALGGTANAVSSTQVNQAQSTANVFAPGDLIVVTMSANSACVGAAFSVKYTRTLQN